MSLENNDEWLETDGRGGYASGTAGGLRIRRYHALLLCATRPPAGRMVLVNGVEAWVESPAGRQALTRQRYAPDLVVPADAADCLSFDVRPWPAWRLRLADGRIVSMACFIDKATARTVLRWALEPRNADQDQDRDRGQTPGQDQSQSQSQSQSQFQFQFQGQGQDQGQDQGQFQGQDQGRGPGVMAPGRLPSGASARADDGNGSVRNALTLKVRPLLSGRDYHSLHRENPAFDFSARVDGQRVRWQPYGDVPAIVADTNGDYAHEPDWYRNFCYVRERERGLDDIEDLATPGVFSFDLHAAPAVMILSAEGLAGAGTAGAGPADVLISAENCAARERRRRAAFPDRLRRAADAYVVSRASGATLLAGYPWFTDWGRDTFIAMRGLLLATGRLDEARAILLEWTRHISQGMLPNRFPDDGGEAAYNSVDASLWFVVAAHDYLATGHADAGAADRLRAAIETIVAGYAVGTRYGIAADGDGLLRAGCPGMQLTWMDAKVGDRVITPRIGKPVEVQALWINALRIAGEQNGGWRELAAQAGESFVRRFPKPDGSGLYDVVDADHQAGQLDGSIRPNQIFAVGGLPHALLDGPAARAVVAQVERELLTPVGVRTLAPADARYIGRYEGGPAQRDGAYHQGTAWPWLLGPFLQAWLRVRQQAGTLDQAAVAEAAERWLAPLYRHLDRAGLDHVSEIVDGDAPHHCVGAPFQAWSLGELLRMESMLDAAARAPLRTSS